MGGFFGVVSETDCVKDVFFGTDYHSHLGTCRGGMAAQDGGAITSYIHDISNTQFRSKFSDDIGRMRGSSAIGVISDYDDQPLIIHSHHGTYAIVTVGIIRNLRELADRASRERGIHFSEMSGGELNPTELMAMLINQGETFADGIEHALESIEGSCSLLLLSEHGIYAARDRYGRTPVMIGAREGAHAATMDTCAFPNLDFAHERDLGPGEVVLMTPGAVEQLKPPREQMQICSFLWVYYGYPVSTYEGINTEQVRYHCGAALARRDDTKADIVSGIPDSGIAHAVGYANESGIPYERPFVKYTPTWPRSFMPQQQSIRDLVARMKLIPVRELIEGRSILFCDDSIVRGTQMQDNVDCLFGCGARDVHVRIACPPLVYSCKYLNFSRSRSSLDLATRRAVKEIEGDENVSLDEYADPDSDRYREMVEKIRDRLGLTSLRYQRLDDLVAAIGLPQERICTHCFDGSGVG